MTDKEVNTTSNKCSPSPLICPSERSGAARNVGSPLVMSDTWGAATLKTTSHLFSQVLECRPPLHTLTVQDGPPTLKTVVHFLLIFVTPPNYTAQKMKRGGGYPGGSDRGLLWLGGFVGSSLCFTSGCVPSTPMASGQ